MTTDEPLTFQRLDGAIAVVTLEDPPWNRLRIETIDRLGQVVTEIDEDDSVRAWVLTSAGGEHFSVGMDLKQLGPMVGDPARLDQFFDQRLSLIRTIETMRTPSVVTLFGNCLGGGLEVPLGCTFRLAAVEGARIGLPEAELGTVPAWGGSARLAKLVGRARALDLILRGRTVDGPEALAIGLVHEVWPNDELLDAAVALARELAAKPRLAVQGMLAALTDVDQRSLDELLTAERAAVHATVGSPDSIEGMMSFLEKRPPVFNQDD